MNIHKAIIHKLEKEVQSVEATLNLAEATNEINDSTTQLFIKLRKIYNQDNSLVGRFDVENPTPFQEDFNAYRLSDRSEGDFIHLTRRLSQHLRHLVIQEPLAKGGYLVYIEYTRGDNLFNSIFLVRDTLGVIFSESSTGFVIDDVTYVDTSRLAMACRINHGLMADDTSRYISLTKRTQQSAISSYFTNWIGITNRNSNLASTNNLLVIVNNIDLPTNTESGQTYTRNEFRQQVYDLVLSSPTKTVDLRTLGQFFYGDNEVIVNYAAERDIVIDTEFKPDQRKFKKFVQLAVKKDGIDLKFSRSDYENKVRISEDNPDLVIIESSALAEAILNEVEEIDNA